MMKMDFTFRTAGYFSLAFCLLNLVSIPLYFIYDGPPPLSNIASRVLINMTSSICLIGFVTGFKSAVSKITSNCENYGALINNIGLCYALLLLVAESIQIGTVWSHSTAIDPTVAGNGGEGSLLIYGPISRILTALLLFLFGIVSLKISLAPAWLVWIGFVFGITQLAFVPSIYFMSQPTDFYSTNGWHIPVTGSLLILWLLTFSFYLIRYKREAATVLNNN